MVLALSLQLLFAQLNPAGTEGVARDPSYRVFFLRLQSAVRTGDRKTVASLSAVPLRLNSKPGRYVMYRNRQAIERDYNYIFSAKIRRAILEQNAGEIWGRDQGVTLRRGEIWFDHECLDKSCSRLGPVLIKAVNRP